jgi:endonuclease/exonuclease/phosphatase family metal-dependent hydrolase
MTMPPALRIASYNLLADSYIDRHRYAHVDPARLQPARRHPALLARIEALDADILCLQEVEADVYRRLEAGLAARGYSGLYAAKLHGKPDGCAAFVRRPRVQLRRHSAAYYRDGAGPDGRSGHLALDLRLESDIGPLRVLGTHLKWDTHEGAAGQHVGERQAAELARMLAGADPRDGPPVVCGDLNATADSRLLASLLGAGLRDPYATAPQPTCNPHQRVKRVDYILLAPGLVGTAEPLPPIGDLTPLPGPGEPSDHLPVSVLVRPADAA